MPCSAPSHPTLAATRVTPVGPAVPAASGTAGPTTEIIARKQSKQALKVLAKYSDGSTRDVTNLASFTSNEKEIAQVDEDGLVTVSQTTGQAVIVTRYMGLVDVSSITVPADSTLPDSFYASLPANNFIDRHIYTRLQKLGFT